MDMKNLLFWMYFFSNIVIGANVIKEIKIGEDTILFLKTKFLKFLNFIEHNPTNRKITWACFGFSMLFFIIFFYTYIFLFIMISFLFLLFFFISSLSQTSIIENLKNHFLFLSLYPFALFLMYYSNQQKAEFHFEEGFFCFISLFFLIHLSACVVFPPLCKKIIACIQKMAILIRFLCFESKFIFGLFVFYYFLYPILNFYFFK